MTAYKRTSAITLVVAVRCAYLVDDNVELLCLRSGERSLYRLFLSTVDLNYQERLDDLDAVEFNIADSCEVDTFLIESLWRVHISPIELQLVCSSFGWVERRIDESISIEPDRGGQSGALLTLIERQLAVCRETSLEPFMMILTERVVVAVERLPYLSELDRARVTSLHNRVVLGLSIAD